MRGAGGERAERGRRARRQRVDAVQLVLQVVQAGRVGVKVKRGARRGLGVNVDRRAVVVHADLLLARKVEVLVQMAGVRCRVAGEQELRRNHHCWAHELWQQVAHVLVVLERARSVMALGLEVLGLPEHATYHPPIRFLHSIIKYQQPRLANASKPSIYPN